MNSDANDLAPTIAEQAALPASSSADGNASQGRSLQELIAADQYINNKAAVANNRRRGLRVSRMLTPGAGPSGPGWGWGCFDSSFYGGF